MDQHRVDQFKDEGKIRLRPLIAYRETGDSREDKREGMFITRIGGTGKLTREESKLILGLDNSIEFGYGGTLKYQLHLAPGYVLCLSTNSDRNQMKEFGNGFFTVIDPVMFSGLLVDELLKIYPGVFSIHGAVVYHDQFKDSEITISELKKKGERFRQSALRDYFVKFPNYQKEAEYRFVFLVEENKPLEDLMIELPTSEIAKCCDFPDPPLA